jgi:hypothetical protein
MTRSNLSWIVFNSPSHRITIENERVVWNDFENLHRPEWDYSQFGPFMFRESEYLLALKDSTANVAIHDDR